MLCLPGRETRWPLARLRQPRWGCFGSQPLDLDARPEAETNDAACGILPVRSDADFVEAILLTGAGRRQAAAAGRATLRRRHDVIAAPALARRVERLSEVGRVRL